MGRQGGRDHGHLHQHRPRRPDDADPCVRPRQLHVPAGRGQAAQLRQVPCRVVPEPSHVGLRRNRRPMGLDDRRDARLRGPHPDDRHGGERRPPHDLRHRRRPRQRADDRHRLLRPADQRRRHVQPRPGVRPRPHHGSRHAGVRHLVDLRPRARQHAQPVVASCVRDFRRRPVPDVGHGRGHHPRHTELQRVCGLHEALDRLRMDPHRSSLLVCLLCSEAHLFPNAICSPQATTRTAS
jgi:hypothetical protein